MPDTRTDEQKKRERVAKLDELTDLILDDLITQARSKSLTSADRKTILDFLAKNGLDLDPRSLPDDVKGFLTSNVSFDGADDENVLPIRAAK